MPVTYLKETPSQTAGPFVHIGLIPRQAGFDIYKNNFGNVLAGPRTKGDRIRIEGTIIDGAGALVRDAVLEIWQADAQGRYAHPAHGKAGVGTRRGSDFRGWGRTGTDFKTGAWSFETIKPGPVMGHDGKVMAPHINFWIVARGINIGLSTRLYFDDEAKANAADPILARIEHAHRRETLIASRVTRKRKGKDAPVTYRFDIRLQGDGETVFFDV